jgi:hypothetical protein
VSARGFFFLSCICLKERKRAWTGRKAHWQGVHRTAFGCLLDTLLSSLLSLSSRERCLISSRFGHVIYIGIASAWRVAYFRASNILLSSSNIRHHHRNERHVQHLQCVRSGYIIFFFLLPTAGYICHLSSPNPVYSATTHTLSFSTSLGLVLQRDVLGAVVVGDNAVEIRRRMAAPVCTR